MSKKVKIIGAVTALIVIIVIVFLVGRKSQGGLGNYVDGKESAVVNHDKFVVVETKSLQGNYWDVYINNETTSCGRINSFDVNEENFGVFVLNRIDNLCSENDVKIYMLRDVKFNNTEGQAIVYSVDGSNFYSLNNEYSDPTKENLDRHEILYKYCSKEKLNKYINWGVVDNDEIKNAFGKYKKYFNRIDELMESIVYENNELYESRQREGGISFDILRDSNKIVGLSNFNIELSEKEISSLEKIEEFMKVKLLCVRSVSGEGTWLIGEENSIVIKCLSYVPPRYFIDKETVDYDKFETYVMDDTWYCQVLVG